MEIFEWVHNNFLSLSKRQPMHQQSQPMILQQKQKSIPTHLLGAAAAAGVGVWSTSQQQQQKPAATETHAAGSQNTFFEWLIKRIVIKGCAELWNVSMLMKLDDDEHGAMSVSHTRLVLEQTEEKRSSLYKNKLLNLLLSQRHWSIELMIESLWWSLGNSINDTNNLKKSHSPGSPFFLGVSLIKLSSYSNATKLEVSIHTLRTEYSMTLAKYITKTVYCMKQYGGLKTYKSAATLSNTNAAAAVPQSPSNLLISAKIKDITAYFINHHRACLLLSFSEITLTRSHFVTHLKLEELQMAIMKSMTASSLCLTDFTDIFANCKLIRLEYENCENKRPKLSVYIPGNTEAIWNSNLHMHILTLARDMQELKCELALPFRRSRTSNDMGTSTQQPANGKLIIELSAERSSAFEIKLSDRHSMQWFVENLFYSRKEVNFISAESIFIKIDDQHIFSLKDVDIHSLPKLDMLTHERANCEGFLLPTNKVWVTTIGSFKAIFPYDHDFYDAVQNQFVSHFKWLKLVHNYKKKPFTAASPLPSDMVIQVGVINKNLTIKTYFMLRRSCCIEFLKIYL